MSLMVKVENKMLILVHSLISCSSSPEPFMAPSEALPETPTLNETTLLPNAEEGFALEPVPVTRMSKEITITTIVM